MLTDGPMPMDGDLEADDEFGDEEVASQPTAWQRNLHFLESSSQSELRDWLIRVYNDADFEPFEDDPRLPLTDQFRLLFGEASRRTQSKLRHAVAAAIGCWSSDFRDSLAALRALAYLAADLRADEALRPLRLIIQRGELPAAAEVQPDSEADLTYSTLLAVIGGFSDFDDAQLLLERLFFDNDFPPIYHALLFTGLCEHSPQRFPEYLPRLLKTLREDRGDNFATDLIFEKFVDVVGLRGIQQGKGELSRADWRNLLDFLKPIVVRELRNLNHDLRTKEAYIDDLFRDSDQSVVRLHPVEVPRSDGGAILVLEPTLTADPEVVLDIDRQLFRNVRTHDALQATILGIAS